CLIIPLFVYTCEAPISVLSPSLTSNPPADRRFPSTDQNNTSLRRHRPLSGCGTGWSLQRSATRRETRARTSLPTQALLLPSRPVAWPRGGHRCPRGHPDTLSAPLR